jgi:pimeloyl-ACP methyl ester carboxylesterase
MPLWRVKIVHISLNSALFAWLARRARCETRGIAALVILLLPLLCPAHAGENQPDKKKEPPEPEEIELSTKDGLTLHATWYASNAGEEAAAIILLHGFGGSRADFQDLASYLQREHDCAVVVPDLRGHGDSTSIRDSSGEERRITAGRLRPDDFSRMALEDVEAVKRFLIQKNNARELNIERLGIVGAGMGALVAATWAEYDWTVDTLPTIKQGRDVKALALLSPEVRFKTLEAAALTRPGVCGQIALQIICGAEDPKALRNAQQVYNLVRRCFRDPPEDAPPNVVREKKKLFLDTHYPTSLQGTKMLGKKLGLEARIAKFFELRLVQPNYPWRERKSPL